MSNSNGGGLSITNAQINFAGVLALSTAIPGTCICFLVLVSYAVAGIFPQARRQLDRVSLRLLVYTLVFNVLFGIAYVRKSYTLPGPGCNFGAFAVNFTLSFSTFFTTCIAINLQLVLVHGVDGKMMEKYYVIVTTILSIVLNVPTFALHQFGWDEQSATCWYKNADNDIRLRWIIGTQSFWISLAATIETICSGVVLVWMFRFHRFTDRLGRAVSTSASDKTHTNDTNKVRVPKSGLARVFFRHPEYRKVVLRIALYPIISLMVNYSTVALDLNITVRGINTQLDFRLLVLEPSKDLILYGVRTSAYGLLASMDPSFVGAIRELFGNRNKTSDRVRSFTSVRFASMGTAGAIFRSHLTNTRGGEIEPTVELDFQQTTHSGTTSITIESNDPENVGVSHDSDMPPGFLGDESVSGLWADELWDFERQL